MNDQNISFEFLNSFVDNQLDSAEKTHAFDAISQNENLKEQVCEMRALKEMVKHAYTPAPGYMHSQHQSQRSWFKQIQPLAACLLLLIGGVSGWLTHSWSHTGNNLALTGTPQATQQDIAHVAEIHQMIVHVSDSNPMKLKAALDETESLLDTYRRANRQIQVEVIANKQGVDLLRANITNYQGRISLMQEKYPNLNFLVCGKTLNKLRSDGESVQLLPHTGIASSAADQINRRLTQGWGYVKI
jgi:intracellular sulfur oxidation DsrE/DsrF family protein